MTNKPKMLTLRQMLITGVLHRLVLTIGFIVVVVIHTLEEFRFRTDTLIMVLWGLAIVTLIVYYLIPEMKILLGIRRIVRTERCYVRKILMVSLFFLLYFVVTGNYRYLTDYTTCVDSLLLPVSLSLGSILRRDSYYVFTNRWIKKFGDEGLLFSTTINFNEFVEINETTDRVELKTERKGITIVVSEILKSDKLTWDTELDKVKELIAIRRGEKY